MSDQAVLNADVVSYTYNSGPEVLHEVSLYVERGEVVGLVGESGSGKSTLGRLLAGAEPPSSGEIRRGHGLGSAGVQMIFQDPYGALNPRLSAFDAVHEVMRVQQRLSRSLARTATIELLESVGLEGGVVERRPKRLSGGQCQRVSIARAIAAKPSVLIADEPTSSLDVSVQAQILNLLKQLQREGDLSVVLISHDLDVIRYMADRTYVMYRGEIVEEGATAQVCHTPVHGYTQKLVSSSGGSPAPPVDS